MKDQKLITKNFDTVFVTKEIIKYSFKANKVYTILILVLPIIIGILPFATAYVFKLAIDYIFKEYSNGIQFTKILLFAGAFVGTEFLYAVLKLVKKFIATSLEDDLAKEINSVYIQKINRIKFETFENSKTLDLINRVDQSIDWRPLYLLNTVPSLISTLISVILATLVIINVGWWLIPVIAIASLPQLFLSNKISSEEVSISDVRSPLSRKYSYFNALLTRYDSVKEIRIFGAFERIRKMLTGIFDQFQKDRLEVSKKKLGYSVAGELVQLLSLGGAFIFVFYQTAKQKISLGDLTFSLDSIRRFSSATTDSFFLITDLKTNAMYLQPFFELLELPEEEERDGIIETFKFNKIEIKNLTFRYPDSEVDVLKDLNLTINQGEKIAIVGLNGSGKTTLIKLILGLYNPTEGEILIDGKNINNFNKAEWFKLFCVLFQDYQRYSVTARDNIEFGDAEKIDQELYELAKTNSDSAEIIEKLDNKDDQMLTKAYDEGTDLSGGQWQRIALARAYFRNSPILVLDEPTAAIDAVSEAKIFENVQNLSKDKTVIIISHRFSTVRKANKIVILENGQIKQQGTHEELMQQEGTYKTMFELQAEGYK